MTADELYQLGETAYNAERYEEALKYYTQAAPENVDAAASIPFCYINLATQVSLDASEHNEDTEYLVKGQQFAVKLLDTATRSSLRLLRDYPDYPYVCNIASCVIAQAINLQYSLVSSGLTTAYRITNTTTTTERTVHRVMRGDEILSETVLWEDVIGQETETFVSLTSFDMHDYHIFGPDEKTKRVRAALDTLLFNTVQIADIMDCVKRPYDAHMIRASMACAMAEADGGDRSMLLPAQWFILRAKEQASAMLTDKAVYENWETLHEATTDSYQELSRKYAALLRSFRKQGQVPYLAKFYADASLAPAVDSCAAYTELNAMQKTADPHVGGKGDFFEVFLTVFAQVSFTKIFPTILFASIISLFCGGIFHVFSADAGLITKLFGIIWFVVTMGLTFFRTITDADEFRTNNTFNIYLGITMGTAILFSINFIVPLIAYLALNAMAKKYK